MPLDDIAYLDQHTTLLDVGRTVRDAFVARHPDAERNAVHAALACVLGGPIVPRFLLLDEPTNHLDLEHLEAVEQALRGYDGALVVVSHDADFVEAIGVQRRVGL